MNYLITGASRGIGYDTALALVQAGHTVLAISRQEAGLQALAQSGGASVRYLVYDITQPDTQRLEDWAAASGPIAGVLNNAGVLINKPFSLLTDDDWQQTLATNLLAPARLIRSLMPLLHKPAHILNISSMGGFQGSSKFAGLSAYSASKAALCNLTECLAEELKDQQISVNALALGAVQTEMLAEAFPGYQAPVSSKDMGQFVAWFLMEGARVFNGKILPVSLSTP